MKKTHKVFSAVRVTAKNTPWVSLVVDPVITINGDILTPDFVRVFEKSDYRFFEKGTVYVTKDVNGVLEWDFNDFWSPTLGTGGLYSLFQVSE